MNEYLKQYIELQKQFRETKGNPDSVRALYTFKEKLELSEDKQAKEVLVDVYDLLDFKKDAYELLCQIGNRSDKKTLKRLGTLKDYAENWGNHYALPKPKTPEEKQKEYTYLRNTFSSMLITGPFSILLGFNGGLMALNDRLKLRSLVAAEKRDMVYLASEESAIRVIEPQPDRIWFPKGGEPVIITLSEEGKKAVAMESK